MRYFQLRLGGETKMNASSSVAFYIYGKTDISSYKARCIRRWADYYFQYGELPKFKGGTNVKTHSIITDENVQNLFRTELRKMKDEDRTPKAFCEILNNTLLSTIPEAKTSVCEETARLWMIYLGFKATKQGKGYYTDGHNREDVVRDREVFLEKYSEYQSKMFQYSGDNLEVEEPPNLMEGEKPGIILKKCIYFQSSNNCF